MTASGSRIADLNERWRDITDQSIGEAQGAIHELLEMLTPEQLAAALAAVYPKPPGWVGQPQDESARQRADRTWRNHATAILAALAQDAEVTR